MYSMSNKRQDLAEKEEREIFKERGEEKKPCDK